MKKYGSRFGRVYGWLGAIFAVCLVAGLTVFLTNYPFGDVRAETLLNSEYYKTINETKMISTEGVTALDLKLHASGVEIVNSDNDDISVTMVGTIFGKNIKDSVLTVENIGGTVNIACPEMRDYFSWGWSFANLVKPMKITVALPAKNFDSLKMTVNACEVNYTAAAEYGSIVIDANASTVKGALKTSGNYKMTANASHVNMTLGAGRLDFDLNASDAVLTLDEYCEGSSVLNASTAKLIAPYLENAKIDVKLKAGTFDDRYFTNVEYTSSITLGQGDRLFSAKCNASEFVLARSE